MSEGHGVEVTHVADDSGRRCGRCGVALCAPVASGWEPGSYIVLWDNHTAGAWRARRPRPTCHPAEGRA